MGKPYIISGELNLPGQYITEVVKVNQLEAFRENLDMDLRSMGKNTVWLDANLLKVGIKQALESSALPVVSLDDRYVDAADGYIGVSRGVNASFIDSGYVPRRGYAALDKQLGELNQLGSEIILADDVLFSGEMVTWLANQLRRRGVKIGAVICGVAIQEGIDKLALENIPVQAVKIFDNVDDEICERDFAFVPGSGRRTTDGDANALYFDSEFGRPAQWASIPSLQVESFCVNSLERNIRLLQEDVPAAVIGAFVGYGSTGSAIEQLKTRLRSIK